MADDDNYYKDRFYPLLWALRDQPELPPPLVLHTLSQCGDFSKDWNEGKRIQRQYGLDAVPATTECEIGAGFWHRVIRSERDNDKHPEMKGNA